VSQSDLNLGAVTGCKHLRQRRDLQRNKWHHHAFARLNGAGDTRFGGNATITSGSITDGTVHVAGLLNSNVSGGVLEPMRWLPVP
jgi:hypothetical protein